MQLKLVFLSTNDLFITREEKEYSAAEFNDLNLA